jgi:hypothetical protein
MAIGQGKNDTVAHQNGVNRRSTTSPRQSVLWQLAKDCQPSCFLHCVPLPLQFVGGQLRKDSFLGFPLVALAPKSALHWQHRTRQPQWQCRISGDEPPTNLYHHRSNSESSAPPEVACGSSALTITTLDGAARPRQFLGVTLKFLRRLLLAAFMIEGTLLVYGLSHPASNEQRMTRTTEPLCELCLFVPPLAIQKSATFFPLPLIAMRTVPNSHLINLILQKRLFQRSHANLLTWWQKDKTLWLAGMESTASGCMMQIVVEGPVVKCPDDILSALAAQNVHCVFLSRGSKMLRIGLSFQFTTVASYL